MPTAAMPAKEAPQPMRVALINPKFRLPIDTRTSPHLGLAYLGAVSLERVPERVTP